MRLLSSVLPVLAGCAAMTVHPHDRDAMLGELRQAGQLRADGDARVAAIAAAAELDRPALVAAALAANRDIEAARQGWRAALAEAAAAGALDDPRASYELAPLSLGSSQVRLGQRIALSQKLPWPGKRALAGEAAVAEAAVLRGDLHAVQLEVAALASELYDDAVLNARARAINDEHRALVGRLEKLAEAHMASGGGTAPDALQAELELGRLEQDGAMLDTERIAIAARINGLLHRDPSAALPAPRPEPGLPPAPPPAAALTAIAIERRPQRLAAEARIQAGESRVRLAERAYYPDLEVMGSYDAMWDAPQHRWMVGVAIDVPIQRGKRDGDVEAARARVAQAQAVRDRADDDIRVEVVRAHRELEEAIRIAGLYDARLLPAARAQVDAAVAGFTARQADLAAVIGAERALREIELAAERTRAGAWQRRAALDRAIGRMPGDPP